MVVCWPSDYSRVYDKVLVQTRSKGGIVFIITGMDTDALCAAKILTTLFKQDAIEYQYLCVESASEVAAFVDSMKSRSMSVSAVFLINCGATQPLVDIFKEHLGLMIITIDHNRPIHLNNIFSEPNFLVLEETCEFLVDTIKNVVGGFSKERGSTDEAGRHFSDDGGGTPSPQWELTYKQRSDSEEAVLAGQVESSRGRGQACSLDLYYSGSWSGPSSSFILYQIASAHSRVSNDILWTAILGISSLLQFAKIDNARYSAYISIFINELNRLNGGEKINLYSSPVPSYGSNSKHRCMDGMVMHFRDFRFPFLQHMSIFDSLLYSPLLFTSLSFSLEERKKKISFLLAKIGISLSASMNSIFFLNADNKTAFCNQVAKILKQFSIENIHIDSFVHFASISHQVTSIDLCFCAESVLAYDPSAPDPDRSARPLEFFKLISHDFDSEFPALISDGISFLKQMVDCVSHLLRRGLVKTVGSFRLVVVKPKTNPRFLVSSFLINLYCCLLDSMIVRSGKPSLPIIMVFSTDIDYILYAFTGIPSSFSTCNSFYSHFRKAASALNIEHRLYQFIPHSALVPAGQFLNFLEALSLING